MFVEVAFPIRGFKTFTYSIPKQLIGSIKIGSRVNVPFGFRKITGIVTKIKKETSFDGKIKDVINIVDDLSIMTPALWKLILWISDYYMTPVGQVAKTIFPKNISSNYDPPKIYHVQISQKIEFDLDNLKKTAPKQYEILKVLSSFSKEIKVSHLAKYVSNPLQICKGLSKKNYVKLFRKENLEDDSRFIFEPIHKNINFNTDQIKVINSIQLALNKNFFSSFLLHGVTGSGKTEIYIEAVQKCISSNRTAIILLPEISLTPQIAGRFKAVFGDKIALWHSKLTQQKRSMTWKHVCQGKVKIIIGARSAIFSPLKNLGLIILDEEHESSYYQDSPAPRYHARDVSLMRGSFEKAVVMIASATPSFESYYNYLNNKINYLSLPNRFGGAKYPKVHMVDMISEEQETGKKGIVISGLLQRKIEERLAKNEQIILLQNRRGFSSAMKCGDCGDVVMCPDCHVSLTFHQNDSKLMCHFCGYSDLINIRKCNNCYSSNMYFSGTGTQKIETLLKETFFNAKIARLDLDTSKEKSGVTSILKSFNKKDIDILIGTQMIAKGLDFPNATLVGIINADLGLYIPDFRSGEKIFQLIYQASGRSGRSKKLGEVVIQTSFPDNPVIKNASSLKINQYYTMALEERKELKYPPFSWLAKVEIRGLNRKSVLELVEKIEKNLGCKYDGLHILGPSPCYLEKLRKYFRYQFVFKSEKEIDPNAKKLHNFIDFNFKRNEKKFYSKKNRINIHFDPMSLI